MSRHSILFFNNFSKFGGNGHDGGSHHTDSQELHDFSSGSETSISQSLEHDLFHIERSAQAHTHDSLGKSHASPQVLKFMNYMKDLESGPTADPLNSHRILTSHATQGNRGALQRVHSLENFEKIGIRNGQKKKLNESLLSTDDRPSKSPRKSLFERRRNKQVPLTSQFRRKSCHCSDCGGISRFELKVPEFVQAYNKQIKMAQMLREKLKEKSPKANSSPHLQLPNLQKMLIEGGSKFGKNRSQKKGFKHKSHNILKIETGSGGSVHFGGRDFHQAGSETPLKLTKRSSIEGKVLSISNGLYHIRIITAPEIEDNEEGELSHEHRRERKDSIKKERGILRPLGLTLKKKKVSSKKNKAKANLLPPQTPRSALRQSIVVEDVISLSRSPSRDPTMMVNPVTVTPLESARTKPNILIKRSSSKISNISVLDSPKSGKFSSGSGDVSTPIQKEMWRPVSMCSPKFKSTFAPKIEEEIEHNNEQMNLHNKNSASVKIVKKVYTSSPKTIPKLKITSKSEFPLFKPVTSARAVTAKSELMDEPRKLYYFNLSSLTERKNAAAKDDSKSKDHSISLKQSYDFAQSPYAFSLSSQRRLKVNSVNIETDSSRPKTSSLEKIVEKTNKLSLKKVFSDKPPSVKSSLIAIHSPKEGHHVSVNNHVKVKDSPVSNISSPREFKPLAGFSHNAPSRRFMFA